MTRTPADPFAEAYPALTRWVREYGWLEVGQASGSRGFIRVLDIGGLNRPGFSGDSSYWEAASGSGCCSA